MKIPRGAVCSEHTRSPDFAKNAHALYFKATHTKKSNNEPRIVRETATRLASFSLSLSLLFFVSEKEERDRARLFFLSFFPFFGGGKLFFSRRGNLNAKH